MTNHAWEPWRIQRLRQALTMTLQEMAGAVGVTKNTFWRWERGQSKPRAKHLRKMAALELKILSTTAQKGG